MGDDLLTSAASAFANELAEAMPDAVIVEDLERAGVPINDPSALRAFVIAQHRPRMAAELNTPQRKGPVGRQPKSALQRALIVAEYERFLDLGLSKSDSRERAGKPFGLSGEAVQKVLRAHENRISEGDTSLAALTELARRQSTNLLGTTIREGRRDP